MKKVIDFNRLPKQEYMKPAMQVIEIRQQHHILVGSPGAKSFGNSPEGLIWDEDGLDGNDV